MSYCDHPTANSFINFNLGFGEQPRNVIRNNINNATCLSSSSVYFSGTSTICNESSYSYTLHHLPANAIVQWSASNNSMTLQSGQGNSVAVFHQTGFTNGEIRAAISINNFPLATLVLPITICQPSISGPTAICTQATYTIENLPAGATVLWSTSNTSVATINTSGLLTKINGGACEVLASLNVNGIQIPVTPRSIWVGNKNVFFGVFLNNYQIAMGQVGESYVVKATTQGLSNNESDYEWRIEPPRGRITNWIGKEAYLFAELSGNYRISLRYNGTCGWVEPRALSFYVDDRNQTSLFTLSPNPATSTTTIQLQQAPPENQKKSTQGVNKTAASGVYEIQLWSPAALIRTYKTDQPTYQISVADQPKGIYFVKVIKDGKTYTQKLIKN